MPIQKRKAAAPVEPGPVTSKDNIPYDYIIIIDSGSLGSRVYIYNWLNPQHALAAGTDFNKAPKVNLVRRFAVSRDGDISESDSDDLDTENTDPAKVQFPSIASGKDWHRKITPGLSSFTQSPQKVGNHHLKYLLNLASSVVPKSEHQRTPIFLHATAGMRLLPPNEQEPILENVCQYFLLNSDFYMPDCKSHVNVIDGDIEGLYGWLSINYLMGAFDKPHEHDHGKGHNTYGLLDMGGASTQVVFQPNTTEAKEHDNNLYKVSLSMLPVLAEEKTSETVGNFLVPAAKDFSVYSDSFLGFGMFQAHQRYANFLLDDFRKENDFAADKFRFKTPIVDPCLPKGYTSTEMIENHNVDFTGKSNFQACLKSIFPVLANGTFTSGQREYNGNCQLFGTENKVSSCLLNDLIPSFDFEVNHFVGVSGYWDAISVLMASQSLPNDPQSEKYDYNVIYTKTQQLCTQDFNELLKMNNLRGKKEKFKEEDLAELCFKASWILNFLHVGLGFPRFGIDENPNKDEKFKSLQVVEKMGGSSFSWTLGRAILYANDEYVQAFNNYTTDIKGKEGKELRRPGYFFSASRDRFIYGAEANGVAPRPMYERALPGTKYPHYDYESTYHQANELKWYIQPHRFYGEMIFILLIIITVLLMVGKSGRSLIISNFIGKARSAKNTVLRMAGRKTEQSYERVAGEGLELDEVRSPKPTGNGEQFAIDSDEEV